MKKIILITVLFFSLVSFGQVYKVEYFDSLNVKAKKDVNSKKVIYEKVGKNFKVSTYKKGILSEASIYSDTLKWKNIVQDIEYYKNGKVSKIENYKDFNIQNKETITFYENGNEKTVFYYQKNNDIIKEHVKSFWQKDGKQTVVNGNGDYQFNIKIHDNEPEILIKGKVQNGLLEGKWETDLSNNVYIEEYYSKGEFLNGTNINKKGESVTYSELNKKAKPKDDLNIFRSKLARKLGDEISKISDKFLEIQVLVRFRIDENGNLSELKIISAFGADKEIQNIITETLRQFQEWVPAENRGEKVSSYYDLPLKAQFNISD